MKKFLTKFLSMLLLTSSMVFATIFPLAPAPVHAEEISEVVDELPLDDENTNPSEDEEPSGDGEPSEEDESPDEEADEPTPQEVDNACQEQTGSLAWIVCPTSGLLANISDALYGAISEMLIIEPLSMEDDAPIYVVWEYIRNITNIVFAIFLVVVIFSQITSIGLNNYGIKRVLPRLIIAVVLVNLSFIICTFAVDVSNIVGHSLDKVFSSIQDQIILNSTASGIIAEITFSDILGTILSSGVLAGVTISALGGGGYIFFMFLAVLVGAIIAVVSGLITIAARQALVALLVMISPLAFVAYLLPNTEKWFTKWKDLLSRMLIFYPMFSFLFSASQLVGYAIILSANSAIGIILGIAVQVFPLFFSWSLMKMSGTILGNINSAVRRVASPLQKGIAGWSLSKADQKRQYHIAHSQSSGAKLRRYLDYRRELRELDTKNSLDTRHNLAQERALTTLSSSVNRDKNGNLAWTRRANRYTTNAKSASIADLRAKTAAEAHANTMSRYGDIFEGEEVKELSALGADSYLDAMQQSFLTKNNAQADQEWLLGQYLDAQSHKYTDPIRYNRLIASAAGALGHNGESSIIGQVIAGNSMIEQRRRSEARIIINKYGIPKSRFRAMILDKAYVNDNGFVTDAEGNPIEDDQYQLLTGHEYTEWQDYIYTHKITGDRISKDHFNSLSATERKNYRRVRYLDIPDDKGNPIATVFEDDAGYMKEILTDDIYIGDPINRRYITEMGVAHVQGERDGILRRYHSTIRAALDASGYTAHAGEVTAMLTSQANLGYINDIGQFNIGALQSLSVASKAGKILQNDKYSLETWSKLITAAYSDEIFKQFFPDDAERIQLQNGGTEQIDAFSHYFPDFDIINYRDVNGKHLSGLIKKFNADGQFDGWEEITENDPRNGLEARKNFVKHRIIPKAAAQLASAFNRNVSQNLLENQKDGTLKALNQLLGVLQQVGIDNVNPNNPGEDTLGNHANFFASQDPSTFKRIAQDTQRQIGEILANQEITGASGSGTAPVSNTARHDEILSRLRRNAIGQAQYASRNDITNIINDINEYFNATGFNYETLGNSLVQYFDEIESLQSLSQECRNLIDQHQPPQDTTIFGRIHQVANRETIEAPHREALLNDIISLIESHLSV